MTHSIDDSAATDTDTPVVVDVLANDSDPDGDSVAIGTLDTYASMFNLGFLKQEVKSIAVRHMTSGIARGMIKGAAMEGLTEGMQEAIQMLGESFAKSKGLDWTQYAKNTVEALQKFDVDMGRIIENVAGGAIPGAVFGGNESVAVLGVVLARFGKV